MNQTEALSWDVEAVTRNSERVARGIAVLDKDRPDWWKALDGVNLNIWCTTTCVLGTVYGSYWEPLERLCPYGWRGSETTDWSMGHGFNAEDLADKFEIEAAWLNAARLRATLADKEQAA